MKNFVLAKKYWIAAGLFLLGVSWWYLYSANNGLPEGVELGVVEREQVAEIVSETGFVSATQAVDLAFERGGRVREILVEEGAEVKIGEVIMRLDDAAAAAELASAQARLEAEQARLQELLAGADSNSLAVTQSSLVSAQTTLKNAERNLEEVIAQQDQLVANAEKTLKFTNLEAYLVSSENVNNSDSFAAPTISGTYDHTEEGVYNVTVYESGVSNRYRVTGLEYYSHQLSTESTTPLGARGLRIIFPANFAEKTEWEIPIPNTRSTNYITNLNAYNAAVKNRDVAIASAENAVEAAEAALTQSQNQLTQVSSSARSEQIAAQRALVKQMQANVESAEVYYDNLTLTAPFSGVISKIDTEVGQIVAANVPVASLISKGRYELTVAISEVDIAEVSVGDEATVHFDAYDDDYFQAQVTKVSPNASLVDGVRVFEVTLMFEDGNEKIRDGLSADIDITTAVRENVLAVPTRSIYEDKQGRFVRVVNADESLSLVRIETGLRGSDGKTEVLSGLFGGETIITFASDDALAQLEK